MERLRTAPQLAPLGAFFSYNNTGFMLLGRLIEVVTGQIYRAAMQELVLDPLGQAESTFTPAEVERHSHALGHGSGQQGMALVTPLNLPRNIDPAGCLWSTTRDQLRYARFHLGDGTAPDGAPPGAAYPRADADAAVKAGSAAPSRAVRLQWIEHASSFARRVLASRMNGAGVRPWYAACFTPSSSSRLPSSSFAWE
jgi:CubicO group peptidase (beta-lactamase class C family)